MIMLSFPIPLEKAIEEWEVGILKHPKSTYKTHKNKKKTLKDTF